VNYLSAYEGSVFLRKSRDINRREFGPGAPYAILEGTGVSFVDRSRTVQECINFSCNKRQRDYSLIVVLAEWFVGDFDRTSEIGAPVTVFRF